MFKKRILKGAKTIKIVSSDNIKLLIKYTHNRLKQLLIDSSTIYYHVPFFLFVILIITFKFWFVNMKVLLILVFFGIISIERGVSFE